MISCSFNVTSVAARFQSKLPPFARPSLFLRDRTPPSSISQSQRVFCILLLPTNWLPLLLLLRRIFVVHIPRPNSRCSAKRSTTPHESADERIHDATDRPAYHSQPFAQRFAD